MSGGAERGARKPHPALPAAPPPPPRVQSGGADGGGGSSSDGARTGRPLASLLRARRLVPWPPGPAEGGEIFSLSTAPLGSGSAQCPGPSGDYAEMVVPSRGRNKESPPGKPGQQQHQQQSPGASPSRSRRPHSPGRQGSGGARAMRRGGGGRRGARGDPRGHYREGLAADGERDVLGRGPLSLLRVCGDRLRGEVPAPNLAPSPLPLPRWDGGQSFRLGEVRWG